MQTATQGVQMCRACAVAHLFLTISELHSCLRSQRASEVPDIVQETGIKTIPMEKTGPSVFPSGEPGVSGDFWGSQEGCQGPFRPSGRNRRRAPAERLLWPGRASPSASQLLAFSPGKEQAAGVWETCLAPGWPHAPQDEAGLTRKFETSHVGGAICPVN